MTTTFEVLGEVAITRSGAPRRVLGRRQPQTVAALLVLERHRSVARSEIADVLWDGDLPPHWAGAVRGVISKIRVFLEEAGVAEWLHTGTDGWRLMLPGDVVVDLEACEALVVDAEGHLRPGLDAEAPVEAADRGRLLGALPEVDRLLGIGLVSGSKGTWWERREDGVAALRCRCLVAWCELALAGGAPDVALRTARGLVELEPFSDLAGRLLIRAHVAHGDRRAATVAHDALVRRLREVGLTPAEATDALVRTVRGLEPPAGIGSRLAGEVAGPLVGRSGELAVAALAWGEVEAEGAARALVVLGEAGLGKTRLAVEVGRAEQGGRLLWGRCSPERQVAFEPVVQILARAREMAPEAIAGLGVLRHQLARLVPELQSEEVASEAAPGFVSAADDRGALFRSVVAAVRAVVTTPTVLVIDDLQWATDDSLALLTHLFSSVDDLPVLVVATCRAVNPSVATSLAALSRVVPTTTLKLTGLDQEQVGALLAADGVTDGHQVSAAVLERTGGNPFFVRELARGAGPDGQLDPLALPPTLGSWISQSVAALGPGLEEVLVAAALLGPQADVICLAAVTEASERVTVERIDALVSAGLLVEGTDGPEVTFNHALTRDAVREGIGTARRRFLHRRIGQILHAAPASEPGVVAHHLVQGGPSVGRGAVAAMLRAGDAALAALAWSSAVGWFDAVLSHDAAGEADQIAALIGGAEAHRGLGDRAAARARAREAVARARQAVDVRAAASATLVLVGGGARGVSDDATDDERARLLAAALDGLGPDDDDLRIPLQIELSVALLLTDEKAKRESLANDALERARALGRGDLLARALVGSRVAQVGPEHAETRLVRMEEVLVLPADQRSHAATMGARIGQLEDRLLAGDRPGARAQLATARSEVEARGHPYWRWVVETWGVLDLIIDGCLDEAEAAAFEALAWQSEHPEALACLGVNLVDIRLFQGRSGEMVDLLDGAAEENPHIPAYRAVLALCLAEAGDLDRAERHYRTFADGHFVSVPHDTNWLLSLAVLADVGATLGDQTGAHHLLDQLRPHVGRQVVLNCFAGGGSYWGPVATQLGRLEAVLGRSQAASECFARARLEADAFEAPLALARIPGG